MIVPAEMLSEDALLGMIEEFVTRDGTDYGEQEVSVQTRVAEVKKQLLTGEALIHYDAAAGSTHIIAASELTKLQQANVAEES